MQGGLFFLTGSGGGTGEFNLLLLHDFWRSFLTLVQSLSRAASSAEVETAANLFGGGVEVELTLSFCGAVFIESWTILVLLFSPSCAGMQSPLPTKLVPVFSSSLFELGNLEMMAIPLEPGPFGEP